MSLVSLRNEALGTSGTYVQHDGPRSHLIDPRTRQPVAHQTVAVSVIAPEGIRADAWATALMILGEAEGRPLAEREHLEALFVNRAPHQEANASWVVPPANGSPEESSR